MRVLFLCTKNSARSQMAEALIADEAGALFEVVASAGTKPAVEADPMTLDVLDLLGVDWCGRRPNQINEDR